jgi:hypothetical protein
MNLLNIYVSKMEVEFPQSVVHQALKCLRGITLAKGHEGKLEETKRTSGYH